jgi:hypothetical protein
VDRYEDAFGTDWTRLEREDVLSRAFALGVASACGRENAEELSRLVEEVDTTYDRSMVELAFHEGRQKGGSMRGRLADEAAVWAALVDDEDEADADGEVPDSGEDGESSDPAERSHDRPKQASATDRPRALSRMTMLDRVTPDDREALRLPRFLRRE